MSLYPPQDYFHAVTDQLGQDGDPADLSPEEQMREETGPVWLAYIEALKSQPKLKELWLAGIEYGQNL